jgi:hypothetical protein
MKPFKFAYEQDCLTPTSWHVLITHVKTIDKMFMKMQIEQDMIKGCMKKSQDRVKTYVDKARSVK